MVGLKKRKIWDHGTSKAVALPPDWCKANDEVENMDVWFNSVILLIPDNLSKEKREKYIELLKKGL